MRKLLCMFGFHRLIWYSEYDKNLYWERCNDTRSKYVTGPLLECEYCDHYQRLENTDASNILTIKR